MHEIFCLRVEIRMGSEKRLLFGCRKTRHTLHIVMTISFQVIQPDQGNEGQVLLQGDAGLGAEVLSGHEIVSPVLLLIPNRTARSVNEGLVNSFTDLARYSPVTQMTGAGKDLKI